MTENEAEFPCPYCGQPAHAGHASDCPTIKKAEEADGSEQKEKKEQEEKDLEKPAESKPSNELAALPALIQKHKGRSADITDQELSENGILRVQYPDGISFYGLREYGRLKEKCAEALNLASGYAFPDHAKAVRGFLDGENDIDKSLPGQMIHRAMAFRKNGVPPIFEWTINLRGNLPVFKKNEYGETQQSGEIHGWVPVIDFVVEYVSGSYVFNRQIKLRQLKKTFVGIKEREIKIAMRPAETIDVQQFRTRAFTPEGEIDPMLIKDVIYYAETHFRNKNSDKDMGYEQIFAQVFELLQDKLKDFKARPKEYRTWDGDIEAVTRYRTWYLWYDQETRLKIADSFFEHVSKAESARKYRLKTTESFKKASLLFPEVADKYFPKVKA